MNSGNSKSSGVNNNKSAGTGDPCLSNPNSPECKNSKYAKQNCPPLKRLHPDSTLSSGEGKYSYEYWSKQSTDDIVNSLKPGQDEPLVVDDGGTVWQGNQRVRVLEERGVDVNSLPRTPKP